MVNQIINGLLNFNWWQCLLTLFILTNITAMAITIYLHRHQAHRGLDLHPIASHFFRFWLWMTTGMVTKEWVAIHRKHHARVETVDDPHSPQAHGLKKVLLKGAELYREEAGIQETLDKFGHSTPDDFVENKLYSAFPILGVSILLILNFALFGLNGIWMWGCQMLWTPVCAAGIINGIGHYFGYRNFDCPDASTNIIPWGIFIGGEELHNNHHAYGTSAKFSMRWWEFDLGWAVICVLRLFGLAKVKRLPVKTWVDPIKDQVDIETLKAVIRNRFQILAQYKKSVLSPVLKYEKQRAGSEKKLFRRARSLLTRESRLVKNSQQIKIQKLLENRETIERVYQFRQKLIQIWTEKSKSQKEVLEALQEWCRQAEKSGIGCLREFAAQLRGFSLVGA